MIKIVHRTEEHVAAAQCHSSILDGGEIDKLGGFQLAPIGDNNAVDSKTRHAAIGYDIQPHMRPGLIVFNGK